MFFSNWIVVDKEEKVELNCKGDMNTIINDIKYTCPNAAASPLRGSICLAPPDLGRFWGGAYILEHL